LEEVVVLPCIFLCGCKRNGRMFEKANKVEKNKSSPYLGVSSPFFFLYCLFRVRNRDTFFFSAPLYADF
jgi:hypothetical protein